MYILKVVEEFLFIIYNILDGHLEKFNFQMLFLLQIKFKVIQYNCTTEAKLLYKKLNISKNKSKKQRAENMFSSQQLDRYVRTHQKTDIRKSLNAYSVCHRCSPEMIIRVQTKQKSRKQVKKRWFRSHLFFVAKK
jgi:hypothetical protein